MKRFAMLPSATLLAGVALMVPANTASAHRDACAGAGAGAATTGAPLFYSVLPGPVVTPASNTTFTFGFSAGQCASLTGLSAAGVVSGWCGWSSGEGTTNSGHRFAFGPAPSASCDMKTPPELPPDY